MREESTAVVSHDIKTSIANGGTPTKIEIWAGPECTVNRVREQYHSQLHKTGHFNRIDDLDRVAALGVATLRYPALWELVAPHGPRTANWHWVDCRLQRIRDLGMTPIIGLVHHGSGPRHTNLLDPAWAQHLADYARAFAERYPWVTAYTPVNEPVTTARFSALYGHWYPHASDDRSFARALVNQVKGIALAMAAIREVNSDAQLIQTEDLSFTHATPRLAYQAAFENERRWIAYELLQGETWRADTMTSFLRENGIAQGEIDWFAANACPPDIIGLDYYALSERFLDDNANSQHLHGNGVDTYNDRDAVRSCGLRGPAQLLRDAWSRLRTPLAITEAHLAGDAHDQIRWFNFVHQAAATVSREGIPLRAVTAWSVFGACDWDTLCTGGGDRYEAGVFDVTSGVPLLTEHGRALEGLVHRGRIVHRALGEKGWWQP